MPMSAQRREATAEMRRKQIIEAAVELFDKKGYPGTTIADVAEKAGISKGLVYKYFQSKQEILLSFDELVHEREKLVLSMPTATESLRLFARRMLLEQEDTGFPTAPLRPLLVGAILGEIPPTAKENYFTNQYGKLFFGPLIKKGQQNGEFRAGDPEEMGDMFWHLLIGYSLHITYQQGRGGSRPNVESLLALLQK